MTQHIEDLHQQLNAPEKKVEAHHVAKAQTEVAKLPEDRDGRRERLRLRRAIERRLAVEQQKNASQKNIEAGVHGQLESLRSSLPQPDNFEKTQAAIEEGVVKTVTEAGDFVGGTASAPFIRGRQVSDMVRDHPIKSAAAGALLAVGAYKLGSMALNRYRQPATTWWGKIVKGALLVSGVVLTASAVEHFVDKYRRPTPTP